MDWSNIAPQFRPECQTPEGRELSELIERHSDEMVRFSENDKPALEAVIPHVPLRLAARLLERDSLMQAFGHMAYLEMRDRGLNEKGPQKEWPWPEIRRTSKLATFHGASS